MSQLPTSDDLLRRRDEERAALERPRERALEVERLIVDSRAEGWELLAEFVSRAEELGVEHRTWHSPGPATHTPRITWVEGYPLTNGGVISTPPLRFCIAERRLVRRPLLQVREVDELSLFVARPDAKPGKTSPTLEQHTQAEGAWPPIARLEHAATILNGVRRELEASLLALID